MIKTVVKRVLATVKSSARTAFPAQVQRRSYRKRYTVLAEETSQHRMSYMNYGFAEADKAADLAIPEEPCQHGLQLYDRVVRSTDIAGKDVLEIGSGRGGGSHYIRTTMGAGRVLGIDLCDLSVALSARAFPVDGLDYKQGDAENLPVESASFDAVVNVESSHCYPSFPRFAGEVFRVLRPGGRFLYTDFGTPERMARDVATLVDLGFRQVETEDITPGVLRALDQDDTGKRAFFSTISDDPERLTGLLNFGRCIGTEGYEAFRSGREVYLRYVFEKP
jgi:SAM-dependent methyltransferase